MAVNWVTNSGFLSNGQLNKLFREATQPLLRFQQYVGYKEAFGKHKGESVNWDKVTNIDTFGGKLVETNTMHEAGFTITQGTLTVDEYGNSIPFTSKMETLSEFEMMNIIRRTLLNDAVKCIDGEIERTFNQTALRYVATDTNAATVTTNGTATATNSSILNAYHIRKMALELQTRNVPGWGSMEGDYVFICDPVTLESLRGAMESVNQYTESGRRKISTGEVGRVYGVRIVEDRFATRFIYNSTARTATAISWTNAKALPGYMFGSLTSREAVAQPLQLRKKLVTDYGRSMGLAWYFLGGWKEEYGTSEASSSQIIKWDSAS
jgi:N4-gp56 family major capsid protein